MQLEQTQIILRSLSLVFLVAAVICVIIGTKVCYHLEVLGMTRTGCEGEITVDNWRHDGRFGGQYFVLITSLILIVVAILLIVFGAVLKRLTATTAAAICAFSALVMLISFCLESWYAAGYGESRKIEGIGETSFYVQSYIAAAIFYFILTVLFLVDCLITYRSSTA